MLGWWWCYVMLLTWLCVHACTSQHYRLYTSSWSDVWRCDKRLWETASREGQRRTCQRLARQNARVGRRKIYLLQFLIALLAACLLTHPLYSFYVYICVYPIISHTHISIIPILPPWKFAENGHACGRRYILPFTHHTQC